jgi:hypothetical protein
MLCCSCCNDDSDVCSTRIAYKVLAGNVLGAENRKRSLLGAKPKEYGSGVFSWWADNANDAAQIGDTFTPAGPIPNTITGCLTVCNDEPACAAVAITLSGPTANTLASSPSPCVFKRAIVTVPSASPDTYRRTLVKYRTNVPAQVKPMLT